MEPREAFAAYRAKCMGRPGAVEENPWDHVAWKVGGKIFAIGTEGEAALTLKATRDQQEALCLHPDIEPAPYLARAGWVRIDPASADAVDLALELIEESYRLVAAALPKRVRESLERP